MVVTRVLATILCIFFSYFFSSCRFKLIAYISRSRPFEGFSLRHRAHCMCVFCLRSRLFVSWDLYSVHFGWPLLNHLKRDKEISSTKLFRRKLLFTHRRTCTGDISTEWKQKKNEYILPLLPLWLYLYLSVYLLCALTKTIAQHETTNCKLKPWLWIRVGYEEAFGIFGIHKWTSRKCVQKS